MISRRRLLAVAAAAPAAALVGATQAWAKPIVLSDPKARRYGPVALIEVGCWDR